MLKKRKNKKKGIDNFLVGDLSGTHLSRAKTRVGRVNRAVPVARPESAAAAPSQWPEGDQRALATKIIDDDDDDGYDDNGDDLGDSPRDARRDDAPTPRRR